MTKILIKKAKSNNLYDVDIKKQQKEDIINFKKFIYLKLQYKSNRINYRTFIELCYKYNLCKFL